MREETVNDKIVAVCKALIGEIEHPQPKDYGLIGTLKRDLKNLLEKEGSRDDSR